MCNGMRENWRRVSRSGNLGYFCKNILHAFTQCWEQDNRSRSLKISVFANLIQNEGACLLKHGRPSACALLISPTIAFKRTKVCGLSISWIYDWFSLSIDPYAVPYCRNLCKVFEIYVTFSNDQCTSYWKLNFLTSRSADITRKASLSRVCTVTRFWMCSTKLRATLGKKKEDF